jgi:NitT/TauT family transport system substrate-binding protein
VLSEGVRRREFVAITASSLLAMPAVVQAVPTSHKISIALAARHSLFHLPLVLAEQLGFLKNEGVQVDWIDCDAGFQAVQAALSGQADVVSGAFEHTLDLQAKGLSYKAFVLQGRAPQISVGLSPRRLTGVKSVQELKAIKLGITSLGSATHWVAQHWQKQAGIASDVLQFVEVGGSTTSVMEAMRAGTIDALCHVDPILHYLEQKNELRIVTDTRTISSTQRLFGGPMVSACLFAKSEFLQKRPELVQAMTTGVMRALNWLKTAGPTDILKTVPSQYWMGDRAIYLGALEKVRDSYSLDGLFANEALQTAWRARMSRLALDRLNSPTLSRAYTNEFVLNVKRKL